MKIKHSKYKNTGILFELLVRQITADTLKGGDSPAIDILKKYFVKTSLGREYKLYESILKSRVLNEGRANMVVSTILESSKKFNRTSLRKQKYNLINEIKAHYNLDVFFGTKIKDYKELASLYTLIEGYNFNGVSNSQQLIDNKITLLEHLTKKEINENEVKKDVIQEFSTYDKDLRILTYKDKATQIKITEVAKYLVELDKTTKINNNNLVDLLQYYELVNEIQIANGKKI